MKIEYTFIHYTAYYWSTLNRMQYYRDNHLSTSLCDHGMYYTELVERWKEARDGY